MSIISSGHGSNHQLHICQANAQSYTTQFKISKEHSKGTSTPQSGKQKFSTKFGCNIFFCIFWKKPNAATCYLLHFVVHFTNDSVVIWDLSFTLKASLMTFICGLFVHLRCMCFHVIVTIFACKYAGHSKFSSQAVDRISCQLQKQTDVKLINQVSLLFITGHSLLSHGICSTLVKCTLQQLQIQVQRLSKWSPKYSVLLYVYLWKLLCFVKHSTPPLFYCKTQLLEICLISKQLPTGLRNTCTHE